MTAHNLPPPSARNQTQAQGRLAERAIAVVDIGSNSIRLVVYEAAKRSAVPLFNEKVVCGLGRRLPGERSLGREGIECALNALSRFRAICERIDAIGPYVVATAAVREAEDGADFVARAEEVCGAEIRVLSGQQEADLAAAGVLAGVMYADGLAGDLGGGSLELIDLEGATAGDWATLPLGGVRLIEESGGDLKRARRIVASQLDELDWLERGRDRDFYVVGGTWRAFAKLHMRWCDYPLRILHQYTIAPGELLQMSRYIQEKPLEFFSGSGNLSKTRQETLPFGALVLDYIVRRAMPSRIVLSAFGVREGLLYRLLSEQEKARDPLLDACEDMAVLEARSPEHARELCVWTDRLFEAAGFEESSGERRLRHAACLASDVAWRMHPEYRGEHSVSIVENFAFCAIEHSERAYLALALFYRHEGLGRKAVHERLMSLAGPREQHLARVVGAAIRTAHMISVGTPGIVGDAELSCEAGTLVMTLRRDAAALDGDRLRRRFRVLAREMGCEDRVDVAP